MTFSCPDTIDLCTVQFSNTALNNMRAYIMNNNSFHSEADIRQEINTISRMSFRRSDLTLMFVSLDSNPQTVTFNYMSGLLGRVFHSGLALISIAFLTLIA